MTFDWAAEIGRLVLIKERLAEVDAEGLWPHRLPEVAATDADIAAAEGRLGVDLDPQHRAFLAHADGWEAVSQDTRILSTRDLGQGRWWDTAQALLTGMADSTDTADMLPVAVSAEDRDVYVMRVGGGAARPGVEWYSGYLVETYPSFEAYFLSLVAANLKEIADLQAER